MSQKSIYILLIFILFAGCQGVYQEPPPAIVVDGISFSTQEFEQEFNRSSYARNNTSISREEFLDVFITKKLVLRVAEKEGLDKNPDFLKDIEAFWQQSLFKLSIDRQSKEQLKSIYVKEEEKLMYFKKNKEMYFRDKTFEEVSQGIGTVLLKHKQQKMMGEWINSLKKQMDVNINYELLGIK